jgi:hypothetical protein
MPGTIPGTWTTVKAGWNIGMLSTSAAAADTGGFTVTVRRLCATRVVPLLTNRSMSQLPWGRSLAPTNIFWVVAVVWILTTVIQLSLVPERRNFRLVTSAGSVGLGHSSHQVPSVLAFKVDLLPG